MKKIVFTVFIGFLLVSCWQKNVPTASFDSTLQDVEVLTGKILTNEQQEALDSYLHDLESVLRNEGYSDEIISQTLEIKRKEEIEKFQ